MDSFLQDILGNIDEGIALLNDNLKVVLWNHYLENLSLIRKQEALNVHIYDIFPDLNKNYFRDMLNCVFQEGRKMFLSAAMHKDLLNINKNINIKLSRIEKDHLYFLLIEFIDVTNQFVRINQLRNSVQKLYSLNKDLKEKEKIINHLAYCDGLTGLPNRELFYKIADQFFKRAITNNNLLGFMFIDIDKFKLINDTYGHKKGDDIIVNVARILKTTAGSGNVVARFGGDEFLILLPSIKSYIDCTDMALKMNENIQNIPFNIEQIQLSFSIGISILPYHGTHIDNLIIAADRAMYEIKNKGGNGYCLSWK